MLTKRGVASVVLLTIITCGFYGIWWTWVTCNALQEESKLNRIPPVLTVLMLFLNSSVGGALLGLDADETINAIKASRGIPQTDNKVLWIVLGMFVPVAVVGLAQHEINGIVDASFPRV